MQNTATLQFQARCHFEKCGFHTEDTEAWVQHMRGHGAKLGQVPHPKNPGKWSNQSRPLVGPGFRTTPISKVERKYLGLDLIIENGHARTGTAQIIALAPKRLNQYTRAMEQPVWATDGERYFVLDAFWLNTDYRRVTIFSAYIGGGWNFYDAGEAYLDFESGMVRHPELF